jgi:G protein-coupled receptor kinase
LECLATFYEPLKEDFKNSELFVTEVQLRHYSSKEAKYADFRVFRVLGRGAFGAVSVVQKLDTHEVFAMKEMDKRRVKHERMSDMCVLEKKVLSKMRSPFVLGLDYALCNDTSLFLIFPLLSGGDLKFHLLHEEEKCFEDARAKFYVAETLLGLEHIHSFDIVYRDLKPANIILNQEGHVVVSDLGLCIQLREDKLIKHLAGTAGYWAPEIVSKQGTYKVSDIWSLGVMMYEMLTGARPKSNANKNVKEWSPFGTSDANEKNALLPDSLCVIALEYPPAFFTPEAKDLLEQIFNQDPLTRIGCTSLQQIKDHAWFAEYDWDALRALEIEPPYVPDNRTVHAESIGDVGQSDNAKYKKEKITPDDELIYKNWYYHNTRSVQRELVGALIKMDQPRTWKSQVPDGAGGCCTLL